MSHNTITASQPTYTGRAGAFSQEYIDAYSLSASTDVPIFTQEVYPQLWKNYGQGFKFLDFLRGAGREFTINGRRLTSFVETHDEKAVATESAITASGSAGDARYIKVEDDDYNADGNCYLRVGNVVYLPAEYVTIDSAAQILPVAYKCTAKTTSGGALGGLTPGTGTNAVYTLTPFNDGALVATEIPAGTKLVVGQTAFAVGTYGIGGVITNELQYDYWTTILKEGCEIEGGADAFRYVVNGMPRLWDRSTTAADFRLDRQMDFAITMGQLNANASLVQTSITSGASEPVLSTEGILPKVATNGMRLPIYSGDGFEFDDFDAIRELLEAKGVISGNLTFGAATHLFSEVEACPFSWTDTGGDHTNNTLQQTLNSFGVNYRTFVKNSYSVNLFELSSLTRPSGFGAFDSMKKIGLILPDGNVSVSTENGYGNRVKMTLPNFALGYLEGRRRIMQPRAGVNSMGYPNTDGYDHVSMDWLTEFMVFMMDFDKMILVSEETYS